MALALKEKVPVPAHCVKARKGEHVYIQYTVRELVKTKGKEMINRSEYKLGTKLPYGRVYEVTELGFRMNVHLYYDPLKAANDSATLFREIERMEKELSEMEQPPEHRPHYDKYFRVNISSKDGSVSFRRDTAAIDEALGQCGFFAIAETDFRKTTAEILNLYRRRDVVEKELRQSQERAGHEAPAYPLRGGRRGQDLRCFHRADLQVTNAQSACGAYVGRGVYASQGFLEARQGKAHCIRRCAFRLQASQPSHPPAKNILAALALLQELFASGLIV